MAPRHHLEEEGARQEQPRTAGSEEVMKCCDYEALTDQFRRKRVRHFPEAHSQLTFLDLFSFVHKLYEYWYT